MIHFSHTHTHTPACVYVFVDVDVCIHVYTSTHEHAYLRACVHGRVRACVRASVGVSMRACMHACVRACMLACMHACVHACVACVRSMKEMQILVLKIFGLYVCIYIAIVFLLQATSTLSWKSLMYRKGKKTSSSPSMWHRYAKCTIRWLCLFSRKCKEVRGQQQRDRGSTSGTMCTCEEIERGTHAYKASKL